MWLSKPHQDWRTCLPAAQKGFWQETLSCQLSSESLQIKCHLNHATTSYQRTYVQWLVYVKAQRSGSLDKLPWGWPVSRLPHRLASPSAQSSSSFSLQSWWSQEHFLTNSCKLFSISAGHSLWHSLLLSLDWYMRHEYWILILVRSEDAQRLHISLFLNSSRHNIL